MFYFKKNIFFLILFLTSCTSVSQLVSDKNIIPGITKYELRDKLISSRFSEDPFLSPCYRKYYLVIPIVYFLFSKR